MKFTCKIFIVLLKKGNLNKSVKVVETTNFNFVLAANIT